MILSLLHRPRWPRQVQSHDAVASVIALNFAYGNTAQATIVSQACTINVLLALALVLACVLVTIMSDAPNGVITH